MGIFSLFLERQDQLLGQSYDGADTTCDKDGNNNIRRTDENSHHPQQSHIAKTHRIFA